MSHPARSNTSKYHTARLVIQRTRVSIVSISTPAAWFGAYSRFPSRAGEACIPKVGVLEADLGACVLEGVVGGAIEDGSRGLVWICEGTACLRVSGLSWVSRPVSGTVMNCSTSSG